MKKFHYANWSLYLPFSNIHKKILKIYSYKEFNEQEQWIPMNRDMEIDCLTHKILSNKNKSNNFIALGSFATWHTCYYIFIWRIFT